MRPRLRPASPFAQRRQQRGAALLTAMIIVTLVATLAASMVWQQWRAVQIEAAERARTQSAWVLAGALDWARLILVEAKKGNQTVTALNQPWAVPLAEARLSTFLAADKENTDDGPEAFLSGLITDAQSRFNIGNVVDGAGKRNDDEYAALERLCAFVGVSNDVAARILSGLQSARAPAGSDAAALLMPDRFSQLSWWGIDADSIRLLEPHATLLPTQAVTALNVNTASREALAAVAGIDLATAEQLLQKSRQAPFATAAEFVAGARLSAAPKAKHDVTSDYFEVRGQLRLEDRVLGQRSLVYRNQNNQVAVVQRERTASRDGGS